MIEFKMPALGSDMDEGTLDEWLVKPGDKVTRGQIVAVVETTKAAVEVECWQEGTVDELLVPVGETVQVGAALATLLAPGERAEKRPHRRPQKRPGPSITPATTPAAAPSGAPVAAVTPPAATQRRRWVSPAARRLAQSLHVDIDAVSGTGPQGAVTISDIEHAAATIEHAATSKEPATKPKAKPTPAERAAQMRKSIAAAMSRSKREIPHYYLVDEIVLENSLTWLTARNAQRSITERVLPAVLLLKAVAVAAQRFGEFNGFWRDDGFQPATGVHVGVGISLRGGGLVAPAIHDVPDKKLDELMDDLTDLVARARSFSLRSSECRTRPSRSPTLATKASMRSSASSTHRRWPSSVSAGRPSGSASSTAGSGSSPPCKPHSPPTTGQATVTAAPCSSPRSTSCSSSPTSSKSDVP